MAETDAQPLRPRSPLGAILVFLGAAGLAGSITTLFLASRRVMEIGGSCASGGPFEIANPCPRGVPGLVAGSIWLGMIFLAFYGWQAFTRGVPNLLGYAWPALFLSLGWNFLQFGVAPPGGGGLVWGWLLCAVMFLGMGAFPLKWVVPESLRRFGGSGPAVPDPPPRRPLAAVRAASPARAAASTPEALVTLLERLDTLHRARALSDEEYEAAKNRVLRGGRP